MGVHESHSTEKPLEKGQIIWTLSVAIDDGTYPSHFPSSQCAVVTLGFQGLVI